MSKLLRVYAITWNYEHFIPDLIKWYKERVDCNITIYDNMSTDLTPEICKDFGCEVISFNTNGFMDEASLIKIRELCWLNPNHNEPWVCVVDEDEWVNVNEDLLVGADWNVNKCVGYELFGEDGDTQEDLIFGLPSSGYDKQALFNRNEILAMNFGAGSHTASPIAKEGYGIKYNPNPVEMFHTKWRGWEAGLNRQKSIAPRVSEDSKRKRWNWHYGLPDRLEEGQTGLNHWDYFNNGYNNRVKVR